MIKILPSNASFFPLPLSPLDCTCKCKCLIPDDYGAGYMDGYLFCAFYKIPPI
jgi:hypothetical protein